MVWLMRGWNIHTLFQRGEWVGNMIVEWWNIYCMLFYKELFFCHFCAITNWNLKNYCYITKDQSPHLLLVSQAGSPALNSRHWLSHCCYVWLIGMFKQIEQCFVDIAQCLHFSENWLQRAYLLLSNHIKGIFYPENKIFIIMCSPSWHSKPVRLSIFCCVRVCWLML